MAPVLVGAELVVGKKKQCKYVILNFSGSVKVQ